MQRLLSRKNNQTGPTLCSTFETHKNSQCGTCLLRGTIKSPANIQPAAHSASVADLPYPYFYDAETDAVYLILRSDASGTPVEKVRILYGKWVGAGSSEVAGGSLILHIDYTPETGSRTYGLNIYMPALCESPDAELARAGQAAGCGAIPIASSNRKKIEEFMTKWAEQMKRVKKPEPTQMACGWTTKDNGKDFIDGFCVGKKTFWSDGTETANRIPDPPLPCGTKHSPPTRGSLDTWRKAYNIAAVHETPGLKLALTAPFAAPLIRFAKQQSAPLVNLFSHQSGKGKSATLELAQSVWGPPTPLQASDTSYAGLEARLVKLNSLPLYWDDPACLAAATGEDEANFFLLACTQGISRERVSRPGLELRQQYYWTTMIVAATNKDLPDLFPSSTSTEQFRARIFQIDLSNAPHTRVSDAQWNKVRDVVTEHYGLAGEVYAQTIVRKADKLGALLHAAAGKLEQALTEQGFTDLGKYRYGVDVGAAMLVGAALANSCLGLTFNLAELKAEIMSCLSGMFDDESEGKPKTETETDPLHLLNAMQTDPYYTKEYETIITNELPGSSGRPSKTIQLISPLGRVNTNKPVGIHKREDDSVIRVSKEALRRYLKFRKAVTVKQFIAQLGSYGHRVYDKHRFSLGSGTEFVGPAPIPCLEILRKQHTPEGAT
jgi:hypothetical protein